MVAGRRFRFLVSPFLAFSVVVVVAACLPVQAQINGVPASVTSFGVRASVTSLGPNCCANFFMPANPYPRLFFDRQASDHKSSGHRHRHEDGAFFPVGVSVPAYIPYAAPDQEPDDDSVDADSSQGPQNGPPDPDPPTTRRRVRDSAPKAAVSAPPVPAEPEQPVTPQPSTVLVFKDGHHADVLNYAIVGDTLFDFDAGRTHKILLADLDLPATRKANDDRGVDFQIPASTKPQ
ncbi:MAG: hypothetical protein ACLPVW_00095 [Terriglobales bacterium]